MLNIRTAEISDYNNVREFYYSLIDALEHAQYGPQWKKDIYPDQKYLLDSIGNGELFIGEIDGKIASCMVVDHHYNDGYNDVKWSVEAKDSELLVIHILGVLPEFSGKGIATQMVRSVIASARENNIRTVRLDVLDGNLPAEITYSKIGFRLVDTIQMYYDDTGWIGCKMFEYII